MGLFCQIGRKYHEDELLQPRQNLKSQGCSNGLQSRNRSYQVTKKEQNNKGVHVKHWYRLLWSVPMDFVPVLEFLPISGFVLIFRICTDFSKFGLIFNFGMSPNEKNQ